MADYRAWCEQVVAGEAEMPPVGQLVGFQMTGVGDGWATFELDAQEKHANPMGTVHGGILCDVADAALATAWGSLLDEGESMTTLELSINFVRPFWTGRLHVEAEVVDGGKTVGVTEATVKDEEGRLIAKAKSTVMTLRGEQAEGR